MKKLLLIFFLGLGLQNWGTAQPSVYFIDIQPISGSINNNLIFYYLDPATCEICSNFAVQSPNLPISMDFLADGNIIVLSSSGDIEIYSPTTGDLLNAFDVDGVTTSVTVAPDGTVYLIKINFDNSITESCLYEFDPATGNEVLLGCAQNYILTDAFFWEGTYYALGYTGLPPNQGDGLFALTTNPFGVSLVANIPSPICGGSMAAVPGVGIFGTSIDPNCEGDEIFELGINGNISFECEIDENICFCYGAAAIPANFPPPPSSCACTTEVGEISSPVTTLCTDNTLDLVSTGTNLDTNDALEYILFSDLTDTLGSVLLTSSTPFFSFTEPPLQTGVTYYVAAIAGDELPGGGVDLTDICLDISNVLSIIWQPLPTVNFTIVNPDVCQGECTEVDVILTGTPPFSLVYDTPAGSGQNASFTGLAGSLTVCVEENAPPGSFNLQAIGLTDANCVCE